MECVCTRTKPQTSSCKPTCSTLQLLNTDQKTKLCKKMAAVTMTSSFLGSAVAAASTARQPSIAVRRSSVVMAKASKVTGDKIEMNKSEENGNGNGNGRREMMFAVAAAAACSVANIALADEPKRGTAEAKKKYAQVCVAMPTARICHN